MYRTDISDILFGSPSPLAVRGQLGVLKDDQVNIIVHGHEPTLSAMLVEASRDPELIAEAEAKGAKGINLAGICCTGNEILMRYGIPPAGNFLHQELAVLTGAVEAMVVDVQCIMRPSARSRSASTPSWSPPRPRPRSRARSTSSSTSTAPRRRRGRSSAWPSTTTPTAARSTSPTTKSRSSPASAHEYLNYMLGGFHRGSFRPLNDAIIAGRIRGLAGVVGCNNARVTQDEGIVTMIKEFIARDVMVVVTGCAAMACAKAGYLSPEILDAAGPGLREVMEAIGIPPVLHLGSLRRQLAHPHRAHAGRHRRRPGRRHRRPAGRGLCPEWMCEKAIAIGTYFAASGAHVSSVSAARSPPRAWRRA